MIKNYLSIIIITFSLTLQAQSLEGFVGNDSLQPLSQVNVLIKKSDSTSLILDFAQTNRQGEYTLNLAPLFAKAPQKQYYIEVTKYGYTTQGTWLKIDSNQKTYQLNFTLPSSTVELAPIVVKAKPKPIKEKNDTLTYDSEAFKDGSERTVEDLLKKLPGIDVDDQGKIKYKGKQVEKVLLEGDDLFDYNYTVGTKNISVDIVDKVQAIEKWSENPLLKGIEDTDKVALNLKLKKGKMKLSGSGEISYGIEDRYQFKANGLAISKKLKNFSIINYNNIGENSSPYDYFGENMSLDEVKDFPLKSSKIIPERRLFSPVGKNRATINDTWYGNTNQILKLSPTLSAKINFNYYQDQLDFLRSNRSNYTFNNQETLTTSEVENMQKSPKLYDGSAEITWNSSKNSLTEFTSKWKWEEIFTPTDLISNEENTFSSDLNSKANFNKQELVYTYRLNNQNALQLKGVYAHYETQQNFDLTPALDFENNSISTTGNTQQLGNASRQTALLQAAYMGVSSGGNKFQLDAKINYHQDQLYSELLNDGVALGNEYLNDFTLNNWETILGGFYKFKWKRLTIRPQVDIKNYFITLNQNNTQQSFPKSQWVVSPILNMFYRTSQTSQIYMSHKYDESPQELQNLYSGFVLRNFRNLTRNRTNLAFQKSYSANTGFAINDLYNQFSFNIGVNYQRTKNNFFINNLIGLNLNRIEYFLLPETNESMGAQLKIEKYLPFLTSTVRLSGNYNYSNYLNIVNNSDLRENTAQIVSSELFYKTAFDFPVNFENILSVDYATSAPENGDSFQNTSFINTAKLLFGGKKRFFASVSLDYFQPSTQNPNPYYFLDTYVRYRTKNKKWELMLSGRNLTNNQFFEEVNISDLGTFRSRQSLNERFVLVTVNFQF